MGDFDVGRRNYGGLERDGEEENGKKGVDGLGGWGGLRREGRELGRGR